MSFGVKPLVAIGWSFLCLCLLVALPQGAAAGPKIKVSHQLEKSMIAEGAELSGSLAIQNEGDEVLNIFGLKPSCGCTTIRLPKNKLEPGEKIEIPFFIDTRGKMGKMEKTITIHHNGDGSPHTALLSFHVISQGMEDEGSLDFILEPPCAQCHIEPATGKQGKPLFDAICSMCHQNGVGSSDKAELLKVITHGKPKKGMPAYGEFLSPAQLASLADHLSAAGKPSRARYYQSPFHKSAFYKSYLKIPTP